VNNVRGRAAVSESQVENNGGAAFPNRNASAAAGSAEA